jgi:single-stranded-DNA-specific exonuclease
MGSKIWINKSQEQAVDDLIRQNSFSRATALFLAARGIGSNELDVYLNSPLKSLSDPFRFPGIDKAVKRLWQAIQNQEQIVIHGDYDTDGVTATALLSWVLEKNGALVKCFLPHRLDDGYGFTPDSLHKAVEGTDSKVLVTVDCGINSNDSVEEANRIGIDVIITDHHEPGKELPNALAIINPKVYEELADINNLSGVGAAFKLSHAFIKYGLEQNLGGFTTDLKEILDFVALGTVADIVPLQGENRILVRHGIEVLKKQLRPGIRALIEIAKVKSTKPSDITFKLAPRINAAGRLGNADVALQLLKADNIVDAYKYAEKLDDFNRKRQEKEREIFNEAKEQIAEKLNMENRYSILVAGQDWHQGVIGIVASRLARDYNRPAIVLTIQEGQAYGSGRSVANLNMVDVLSQSSKLLTRFGGHPMAVGLGLDSRNINQLHIEFEKHVRENLTSKDLIDHFDFDGEVELRELKQDFFDMLDSFEPFGHSNPQPVFRINHLTPVKSSRVGEKHCRGQLCDHLGYQMDFIAFNQPMDAFPEYQEVDILATPQINNYYGTSHPQLQVMDIKPSY